MAFPDFEDGSAFDILESVDPDALPDLEPVGDSVGYEVGKALGLSVGVALGLTVLSAREVCP